jgi:hypothetical protein
MASIFSIITTASNISIGKQRRATVLFTVTNSSSQSLTGRSILVMDPPNDSHSDWLGLKPPQESERSFPANGVQDYIVDVNVPVEALAGDYLFHLDMLDIDNPDETYTIGPPVMLAVAEPPPPPKEPFPWKKLVYQIFTTLVRSATNVFTLAVLLSIVGILAGPFYCIPETSCSFFQGFLFGFIVGLFFGLYWAFSTTWGIIVTILFVVVGLIHGIRLARAESYFGVKGFLAFLWDHLWNLPNTILGSIFALITIRIPIDKSLSAGTGRLVLMHRIFRDFDTTIGNVTAGNRLNVHEGVHVLQARIFGLLLYPIWIINYIINTILPWWLIIQKPRPSNFKKYFVCGVYPYTLFELWAYRVEGTRPSCTETEQEQISPVNLDRFPG